MSSSSQEISKTSDPPTSPTVNQPQSPEDFLASIFISSSAANLAPWIDAIRSKKIKPDTQDPNGYSVLHLAVWFGDLPSTSTLIKDLSMPISIRSKNNQTPLSLAAAKGYIEILNLLLEYGADLEAKDDSGMTPILCAAHNGQVIVWLILKAKGSNIWVKDNSGNSAAHLASTKNQVKMLRVLQSQDFNLEEPNSQGQSPIHKACEFNSLDAIEFLLSQGVSTTLKDHKGKDPIELSEEVDGARAVLSNFNNISLVVEYFGIFYHIFWTSIITVYTYEIFQDTLICLPGNLVLSLSLLSVIPLFWIVKRSKFDFIHPMEENTLENQIVALFDSGKLDLIPKGNEICFTCQIARPMKSKHCRFTNKCLVVYDHYNYYLKRPIGKGNLKSYVLGLFINLLSVSLFNYLLYKKLERDLEYAAFTQYFMEVFWSFFKIFPLTQVLVLISLAYNWTILWYFAIQVICISQGLTVNEALNRHKYSYFFQYQQVFESYRVVYSNPHTKGFLTNWLEFLVN